MNAPCDQLAGSGLPGSAWATGVVSTVGGGAGAGLGAGAGAGSAAAAPPPPPQAVNQARLKAVSKAGHREAMVVGRDDPVADVMGVA
jgi:hypothetical protein